MKSPLRILHVATLGLALASLTASESFAFNPQPEPPKSSKSAAHIKANPHVRQFVRGDNWTASQKLHRNPGGWSAFNPQPEPPKYNSAKQSKATQQE